MSRSARGLGQVLLACVREVDAPARAAGSVPAVRPGSLTGLLSAARRHRVAPAVHRTVRAGGPVGRALASAIDADTRASLHDDWLAGAGRHMLALRDLAAASDALVARGVGFAVCKGPVLSVLHYPRADLRPYVDLDLLVTPHDLQVAVGAWRPPASCCWTGTGPSSPSSCSGSCTSRRPPGRRSTCTGSS